MKEKNKQKKHKPIIAIVMIAVIIIIICLIGSINLFSPANIQVPTSVIIQPSVTEGETSVAQQLAAIDLALQNALKASIAYNVPEGMNLDETTTIELLLNPSMSPTALAAQVVEGGQVTTSSIDVTSRMIAELIPQDDGLVVTALENDSEQLISGTETTKWTWYVTARKGGIHQLTLVIYRLVNIDGEEYWRRVESYEEAIEVEVNIGQRIRMLDWMWIAVALMALAAISFSLAWYAHRKSTLKEAARRRQTAMGSLQGFPQDSPLAGLPQTASVEISDREITGKVFISYRRSDSADITGRIYDRLVGVFGRKPVFKDVDSIPLGTDFKEYLDQQVSNCNVLLAIIGDRWVDARGLGGKKRLDDPDDFVRLEIESALEQGIPVIPLLVRGAHMPDEEELPPSLRKLVYKNGIPIRPDPDFHNDMDRLISSLEKYIRVSR